MNMYMIKITTTIIYIYQILLLITEFDVAVHENESS